MWRCPYCDTEMLTRSRSGHLKNKQGCSQQHALHLAEEAKKEVNEASTTLRYQQLPSRGMATIAAGVTTTGARALLPVCTRLICVLEIRS